MSNIDVGPPEKVLKALKKYNPSLSESLADLDEAALRKKIVSSDKNVLDSLRGLDGDDTIRDLKVEVKSCNNIEQQRDRKCFKVQLNNIKQKNFDILAVSLYTRNRVLWFTNEGITNNHTLRIYFDDLKNGSSTRYRSVPLTSATI